MPSAIPVNPAVETLIVWLPGALNVVSVTKVYTGVDEALTSSILVDVAFCPVRLKLTAIVATAGIAIVPVAGNKVTALTPSVGVGVCVLVYVLVFVAVFVEVFEYVFVKVCVGVSVIVCVCVSVDAGSIVSVSVKVCVCVDVFVFVYVSVGVFVYVGVFITGGVGHVVQP